MKLCNYADFDEFCRKEHLLPEEGLRIVMNENKRLGVKPMTNYEDLTTKELLEECEQRGLLDNNHKYHHLPKKEMKKYSWKRLQQRMGLSDDELLAITTLGAEDGKLSRKLLKLSEVEYHDENTK